MTGYGNIRLLVVPHPDQIVRLLEADVCDPNGPLRLREDLPPMEFEGSVYLANARLMIASLGSDGVAATAKGNLGRAFVLQMADRMSFTPHDAEWRSYIKVRSEQDVWPLHVLRIVMTLAGLVRKYRGRFLVTKRGRALAAEERVGALQALLFRTFFGRFNLGYLDGCPPAPAVQQTVLHNIWMMSRIGCEWMTPEDLREVAQLGIAFPPTPEYGMVTEWENDPDPLRAAASRVQRDLRQSLFELRAIRPLENFGLLETKANPSATAEGLGRSRAYLVRKTPLFGRFVEVDALKSRPTPSKEPPPAAGRRTFSPCPPSSQ